MTPTEFQITSITRSIMFSDIGNGREFYHQVMMINAWVQSMGYTIKTDNYVYENQYYRAEFINNQGKVIKIDYLNNGDFDENVNTIRKFISGVINEVVDDKIDTQTTQLQDIKSTCLTEQQVSSYVDSISKDLPTIGKLIDYLTRLGYNPQLIMDATQHNNERVVHICSPFTLCSTKYSYDSNVHAIHRFVVIDQHNRNVAVSIANTITDNNHITITNFADKYGWKRETCEAKDKWKWVNGGFHYELPFDKNDIPNTYCTLIHHIVEAEQNKVCSMQ